MVSAILVGLTLGLVAKYLILGHYSSNFIVPVALGLGGSLLAHLIGLSTESYKIDDPVGFLASVAGACLLLGIYWGVIHRRRRTTHQL